MSKITNIIAAGLGGQGVLKITDILADVIFQAGLDVKKYYQTILRIHDGSYLQVLAHTGGQVQRSTDLKNWKNCVALM